MKSPAVMSALGSAVSMQSPAAASAPSATGSSNSFAEVLDSTAPLESKPVSVSGTSRTAGSRPNKLSGHKTAALQSKNGLKSSGAAEDPPPIPPDPPGGAEASPEPEAKDSRSTEASKKQDRAPKGKPKANLTAAVAGLPIAAPSATSQQADPAGQSEPVGSISPDSKTQVAALSGNEAKSDAPEAQDSDTSITLAGDGISKFDSEIASLNISSATTGGSKDIAASSGKASTKGQALASNAIADVVTLDTGKASSENVQGQKAAKQFQAADKDASGAKPAAAAGSSKAPIPSTAENASSNSNTDAVSVGVKAAHQEEQDTALSLVGLKTSDGASQEKAVLSEAGSGPKATDKDDPKAKVVKASSTDIKTASSQDSEAATFKIESSIPASKADQTGSTDKSSKTDTSSGIPSKPADVKEAQRTPDASLSSGTAQADGKDSSSRAVKQDAAAQENSTTSTTRSEQLTSAIQAATSNISRPASKQNAAAGKALIMSDAHDGKADAGNKLDATASLTVTGLNTAGAAASSASAQSVPAASPAAAASASQGTGQSSSTMLTAVKQVSDKIQLLAAQRSQSSVTIQLNPKGLGQVTVTVAAVKQAVQAVLSASNSSVSDALTSHKDEIESKLAQSGYSSIGVTVSTAAPQAPAHSGAPQQQTTSQNQFSNGHSQQNAGNSQNRHSSASTSDLGQPTTEAALASHALVLGQVDLRA